MHVSSRQGAVQKGQAVGTKVEDDRRGNYQSTNRPQSMNHFNDHISREQRLKREPMFAVTEAGMASVFLWSMFWGGIAVAIASHS